MSTRLDSVVFDAREPGSLARFWCDALGWTITFEDADEVRIEPPPGQGAPPPGQGAPPLVFLAVSDPKVGKNRVHLDLASASSGDQAAIVQRLEALGATPADIGQSWVPWVVLSDPEGNELCVLEPRAQYRDTGPVAAVVIDARDPARLAAFWGEATGWPVVRSHETFASLRAPEHSSPFIEFITNADAKATAKLGKNRLHLDVAPFVDDDQQAEVARLERFGARPIDIEQGEVSWVVLADPEGNEFCVLSPR